MSKHLLFIYFILTMSHINAQDLDIYSYSFINIEGEKVDLSSFKGKKILFVNVASKCGFTGQYKQLQQLHEEYGDNLVLIGFPCNQFAKQEKGSEAEIQTFCKKNYGVEFLMASKIDVKGKSQHPIYNWLTSKKLNGVKRSKVRWNFNKYLVDENGQFVAHFKTRINPKDDKITTLLK